jgi:hypothetical protein
MKPDKKKHTEYPGKDSNRDLPFESPQNEESRRLAEKESASAIERKDKSDEDEGKRRGGNQSVNQS